MENSDEFYGSHLLEKLLEESEKHGTHIQFIDRDPTYFNYILDHLRDPKEELILPEDEFILKKIQKEAKYFMVEHIAESQTETNGDQATVSPLNNNAVNEISNGNLESDDKTIKRKFEVIRIYFGCQVDLTSIFKFDSLIDLYF